MKVYQKVEKVVPGTAGTDAVNVDQLGALAVQPNLLQVNTNGNYGDTTGWAASSGITSLAQENASSKFGNTRFKVVASGAWSYFETNTPASRATVEYGKTYTLSYWVKMGGAYGTRTSVPYTYLAGGTNSYVTGGTTVTLSSTEWKRVWFTFTPASGDTTATGMGLVSGASATEIYYFSGFKIEEGSTPTAYVAQGPVGPGPYGTNNIVTLPSDFIPTTTSADVTGMYFATKAAGDYQITASLDVDLAATADATLVVDLYVDGVGQGPQLINVQRAADNPTRIAMSKTWHAMDVGNAKTVKLRASSSSYGQHTIHGSHSQLSMVQIGN